MSLSFPGHSAHIVPSCNVKATVNVPSDSVREVENRDGTALLDIQQGLCLGMTPLATKIWRMLKTDLSADQITSALTLEFPEIPSARIRQDVHGFIIDLNEKGLLVNKDTAGIKKVVRRERLLILALNRQHNLKKDSKPGSGAHRFLFWKALFALIVFDLFKLGSNFARIHTLVRSWGTCSPPASTKMVEQVCRAINHACLWYPKRVLCLQRSAVTTCLLRNCGVPAQMVIGAQKCPFKAHAWTEVDGQAINERRDVQAAYLVWERC
jgi:hypothetical protein